MLHAILSKEPWFHPKKFGYGAGLPCAWQGWVSLTIYVLAAIALAVSVEMIGWVAFVLIFSIVTLAFVWLAHRHTQGGWRWRP